VVKNRPACGLEASHLIEFVPSPEYLDWKGDEVLVQEMVNHEPAVMFVQTGSQQSGRPSMGSWVSYGLGSDNQNLPHFMVLISKGVSGDQPL